MAKKLDLNDPVQRTKWAVKDIKTGTRWGNRFDKKAKRESFHIDCANGYDGIVIDAQSVKVIDAKKGLIQMRITGVIGA